MSDEWAAFLEQREALLSRSEEEWVTEEFACWKLLQVLNEVQALGGETFLGKDSDSGEDSTSGDDHDGTAFDDIREPEEPVRQPPSLLDERCLTFSEAAEKLSQLLSKKVAPSTVWRWTVDGIQGVHLESRKVGGTFVTSLEAIDRFTARLADATRQNRENRERTRIPAKPSRSEKKRQRDIAQAKKRLEDAGI